MGRSDALIGLALAALVGGLVSCAAGTDPAAPVIGGSPAVVAGERSSPEPARPGTQARSQVERFAPEELGLPSRARAPVVPVVTVDGELKVPTAPDRLGWWDGSAYVGDPFGATVIAGHVDSATDGLGFFAQLPAIEVGDQITVLGDGPRQRYQVTSVRSIAKNALAADGDALSQTGDHRLVLITCTGDYHPEQGGYEQNLVVTAEQRSRQGSGD
ncbi:MAG: class F sortase [Microlunatus sp.]|nr:class F sortase [Microlunatus sp.]